MIVMESGKSRDGEVVTVRKGPWMAEEDEILMDYVKKYGPRDWSSIRSKGLLPRTGKSCRLRWVNKLKPDLKTGCKFTPEEERVVIDLQARFGNKWARIATYLSGRTDNDVKNFWSTRQKRLARILQTPTQAKSHKSNDKTPISLHQVPALESSRVISTSLSVVGEPSLKRDSCHHTFSGGTEEIKMIHLPNLMNSNMVDHKPNKAQLEFTPTDKNKQCIAPSPPPQLLLSQLSFPQLPQTEPDLPILPEMQHLVVPELGDGSLLDMFGNQDASDAVELPFFAMGGPGRHSTNGESGGLGTADDFFDDFPMEALDYNESLPSPSEW
ncbi:hypothetical protein Syun_013753 [Stephania yunnanensis]|uniref:Uncharacterized protein n=1 Tax=Stephania yunnanensis TaxID=152371 RepID=A0AAP0P808_9MAGN